MMRHKSARGFIAGLLVGAALCGSLAAGPLVFDKDEYAARRAKLMEKVADGAAVILGALPPTAFVPFVQSNDFLYLTGVEAPNAALVVDGKRRESILFLTLTERAARNDGISLDLVNNPQAATGIERVLPADQLLNYLGRLGSQGYVLYTPFQPEELSRECSLEKLGTLMRTVNFNPLDGRLTREQQFVRLLRDRSPAAAVKDASPLIWALRVYKSPAEAELLRRAARIGVQAYREVLQAVRPGMPEYELAALFEYHCKKAGAQDLAYYAIISSGENHPYVHYYKHDRVLQDGDIVVMDCGPDLNNYDIDITVTFPVSGEFTPRQKEIYEAVLAVHKANLSLYRPGLKAAEVRERVREILIGRGFDLDKDVFKRLAGGFGHYVGMAVHDVGGGPAVLEPGMVFANEPLVIFADEKIGVRIENTVLVTDSGMENLTAGIPRETRELEALMKAKK
ncbi:MAG: Xaa-Pro peptidase family protein [Candidatus Aminicenantes bacterium]|nr:Xaa-Pro peptidase family protein [Candidatus Aminicenantes bacterium]